MVPSAPCWNGAPGKLEGGTAWRTPSSELCQCPNLFPNGNPTAQSNGTAHCSCFGVIVPSLSCSASLRISPEPNTMLQPFHCHPTASPLPSLLPALRYQLSQCQDALHCKGRIWCRCDLFLSKLCRAKGLSHCARRKSGSEVGRKEFCPPQDLTAAPRLCRPPCLWGSPPVSPLLGTGFGEGMDHHGAVPPSPWRHSAAFLLIALPQRCVGVKAAALTRLLPVSGSAAFPTRGLGKAGNTKHPHRSWQPKPDPHCHGICTTLQ